ncbi:MAG: phenylalanine--tRNA ligase subunit beta, partial [Betaproteobacteria bacterium]|nr:phenylalanine--tRNA ligase subunit beta [Betaproteobacteria bacterium]
MKISERWLRAYVDPPISTTELSDRMTMAGLEVEAAEPAAPPFQGVVVAEICAFERHPDADRLNVCQVDAGERDANGGQRLRQIVCGAPNVAIGMKVPCALPGALLPGAVAIGEAKMRGVTSLGMLCSARELGLSTDHGGLLALDGTLVNGQDIREALALDDTVFELKLTPNRADCLSMVGVAREVSALTGAPIQLPTRPAVIPTLTDRLAVRIEAPDLCGRFSGRVIRGVNARAETPDWMRSRLERAGQRSISALVDLSNYVMLELGRPTHVFDLNKLGDASQGLTVRWAHADESLTLLNGQTVKLAPDVGVIAASEGPESLAGIMGGEAAAVSLDTTDIYVEAAFWWPTAIAGRARRFNFVTDAGHRFERGVDAQTTVEHLDYLSALILEICGGQAGPIDDQITALPERPPVTMRVARANRILGLSLNQNDCAAVFDRLGFAWTANGATTNDALSEATITVVPPSWRFDLAIEEDLIEEVARIRGFDSLPLRAPLAPANLAAVPGERRTLLNLKRALAARDYQEIINFSFVSSAGEQALGLSQGIRLLNPIAEPLDVMRTTLIGGLLETLQRNLNRSAQRVRLFEAGRVFLRVPGKAGDAFEVAGVEQPMRIAALAFGDSGEPQWGLPSRTVDFYDAKADLEVLLGVNGPNGAFVSDALTFNPLTFEPVTSAGLTSESPGGASAESIGTALHPGRSARVHLHGQPLGWIGELHPRLVSSLDLPRAPIVFELDVEPLLAVSVVKPHEPSKFPQVVRDLALVVGRDCSAQSLLSQLRESIEAVVPDL